MTAKLNGKKLVQWPLKSALDCEDFKTHKAKENYDFRVAFGKAFSVAISSSFRSFSFPPSQKKPPIC
jgi:hypothetical protein